MNAEMSCVEIAESAATTSPIVPGDYAVGREFDALFGRPLLSWTVNYRLIRRLGSGGQGVVYLAEKIGTDGLRVPVALKFFSRQPYADGACYADDMKRMACIAAKVALIQQDHLLDVHDFVEIESSRIMVMEWVDGLEQSRASARSR